MEENKKPIELVYQKPSCPRCGFTNTLQNVTKHINSKRDVCSKYKIGILLK